MKNDCQKWKDLLLDAALTGTLEGKLETHLANCTECSKKLAALRARRERLDALLPLVAEPKEPSADFRARVLAAAESAKRGQDSRAWRIWGLAGALAIAVALVIALGLFRRPAPRAPSGELAQAEKLAEWRAPSDVLLETPGREILKTTPRLGESYLRIPPKKGGED